MNILVVCAKGLVVLNISTSCFKRGNPATRGNPKVVRPDRLGVPATGFAHKASLASGELLIRSRLGNVKHFCALRVGVSHVVGLEGPKISARGSSDMTWTRR